METNIQKRYIYNKQQALFFIHNEHELFLDVDKHYSTHKMFFVFKDCDRLQELYKLWNNKRDIIEN